MADLNTVIVSCSRWEEIVSAKNAVIPKLPPDVRKRLNKVFSTYLARHGLGGVFERLNNRSVATILAEYDPAADPTPIASGETEGLRWKLFEAPDASNRPGQRSPEG
jgi:hypothetical protein